MLYILLFVLVTISSVYYLHESSPTTSLILTIFGCLVSFIHILNHLAKRADPYRYTPNIQNSKVSLTVFHMHMKNTKENIYEYNITDHKLYTEDGYELNIVRVSLKDGSRAQLVDQTKKNHVVQLVHGWAACCETWFLKKNSVGFYFVNKGYDVWTINLRGNKYNLSHRDQSISTEDFFNYTIHDHALKDIPSIYRYVLNETNQEKLIYVAHSMGGMLSIMAHSDPVTQKYMKECTKRSILLASLIYPGGSTDPYVMENPKTRQSCDVMLEKAKELKIYNYQSGNNHTDGVRWQVLSKYLCDNFGGFDFLKTNLANTNSNHDTFYETLIKPDLPYMLFPFMKFFGHGGYRFIGGGSGSSVMATNSIFQLGMVDNKNEKPDIGKIRKYDYGNVENMKIYGKETPDLYHVNNIEVPVDLIVGTNDMNCNQEMAELFAKQVNSNRVDLVKVHSIENWGHYTFIVPRDVSPLTKLMDKILLD